LVQELLSKLVLIIRETKNWIKELGEHAKWHGAELSALRDFSFKFGNINQKMMDLLDKKGADFYSLSDMGYSVIHTAIEHNSIHSLAYFYYQKCIDFEIRNAHDMTPFLYAVNQKYLLFYIF
jgi:hypothetical protein